MNKMPTTERHEDIRYEHSDINPRGTFITGVGVIVGTWITVGVIFFVFTYLAHRSARLSPPPLPLALHGQPLPPEPRLQKSPHQDLKAYLKRENWELTHSHWIDKSKGIVSIPIEQAMQIVAQKGIPPAKTPPNPTLTPPTEGTRLTGFEGKVEPEPR
jgi:hypothetical protein